MTRPRPLAVVAGLSLGLSIAVVAERERLEAGPPGWTAQAPGVPLFLATDAGAPRLPGQGWPLAWLWSLRHDQRQAQGLAVQAELPAGASLAVGLEAPDGQALLLSARAFGDRLVTVGVRDRSRGDGMQVLRELRCDARVALPAQGPILLAVGPGAQGGVQVQVGDQEVRCDGPAPVGTPLLQAGLRRVGLHRIEVAGHEGQDAPGPSWPARLLAAGLGAGLAAAWPGVAARARLRADLARLCLLPWLLAGPLAFLDLEGMLQATRIVVDHPLRVAVVVPLLLSAVAAWALGSGTWLAREATDRALSPRAVAVVASGATLSGLLVAAARPQWAWSALFAAGAGASLGALLWLAVRATRVRLYNPLSLALAVACLAGAEQALTWTATGQRLVGVSNRSTEVPSNAAGHDPLDDFAIIDGSHQHTRYPSHGYPVAPPPRTAPVRIVALGSSSTGGAYQFDDLDQFWPAELERRLGPGVQVVNQGVGGWTTVHIRRYVETRLLDLDPDILVVYQGHNDFKQPAARPYAAVYAERSGAASAAATLSGHLARVRLYQLLRFALTPLSAQPGGIAVPIPDARRNLARIIDLAGERDARVLLVREGTYPDPSELAPYGELMASLADGQRVAWLDGGQVLAPADAWNLFLDGVHLTAQGHRVLAQAMADELRRLGWL